MSAAFSQQMAECLGKMSLFLGFSVSLLSRRVNRFVGAENKLDRN
jgi:hypothetical protein